ncbi:hypothetical protein ABH966_000590 [Lysinibacillus sp. RC46]|uniref:hypothetical protein n=1 Tax=unclassified Lysinibacillus TaxID=2636778 RepID=UPI003518C7D8
MNADGIPFQWVYKHLLNENKAFGRIVYLCESEASAANVFCAKAKRQRQLRQGEIDFRQDTLSKD